MLQDLYVRLLLARVRDERYPNPEDLDRIERALRTPEELREYIELLVDRVVSVERPSTAMLDRFQRFAALQESVRKRGSSSASGRRSPLDAPHRRPLSRQASTTSA
jgi:hypothetical protein